MSDDGKNGEPKPTERIMTETEHYLVGAMNAMIEATKVLDLIAEETKEPLVAHICRRESERLWSVHREIEEAS